MRDNRPAPGRPGIPARWTSSAKSGVGTALGGAQPRLVHAQPRHPQRDLLSAGRSGLHPRFRPHRHRRPRLFLRGEARRAQRRSARSPTACRPLLLPTRRVDGRYPHREDWCSTDPRRDVVLQRVRFTAARGRLERLPALCAARRRIWSIAAPATPPGSATTRACRCCSPRQRAMRWRSPARRPWRARSVGFVGVSDGWQDLSRHFALTWRYDCGARRQRRADRRDRSRRLRRRIRRWRWASDAASDGGGAPRRRAASTTASMRRSPEYHRRLARLAGRAAAARSCRGGRRAQHLPHQHRGAAQRTRRARFPAAIIASLSIPWGFSKGDDDLGGYHLVWPRDLVETAGALLACGAIDDARRVLRYLEATQEADGHWPQNCWLDGTRLLERRADGRMRLSDPAGRSAVARRRGSATHELRRFWPMVRRAAAFVVRNGPVTGQDRWEEDGGYSPFTLAVEIAALLAAADLAEHARRMARRRPICARPPMAGTTGSSAGSMRPTRRWRAELGVEGYYVRIAPPETADGAAPVDGFVPIKNRPPDQSCLRAGR